ncbi:MAG: amidohydrolase family protein, partial [Acidimicrobiia bacterium]
VVVSVGHSAATASTTRKALDAGATMGTHLFNAMPPMTAREPGIAGVLISDARTHFGMIVDGHHHDPAMVAMAWAAAPERFCLVTDGIAAMGLSDGSYTLGPIDVTVVNGAVRNAEGNLAGASATMDRELSLLISITGASLEDAVKAATFNPSEAIGAWDRGRIRRGSRGDLVLLDGDKVAATIVGGEVVHLTEPDRWKGTPHAAS